jgi:hypothetical protein
VPVVHIYVTKLQDKDGPVLGDVVEDALRQLNYVSEAKAYPTYSVLTVSFKEGRNEGEEIERAIERTGYEISQLSVREGFPRE